MGRRRVVQVGGNAANVAANTITIAPNESAFHTTLGGWLLTVLPAGCVVLQGQQNQTAAPIGLFATMTIIRKERIATNSATWTAEQRSVVEPTRITVQVNLFGPGAGDAVHRMIALFRDLDCAAFFAGLGLPIAPLFASEARQMGFITAERQYQDQWSADLMLQVNYLLTLPQQSAISITAEAIEADAITSSQE